jgi:TM2 domain-containing membrane protein YozV
VSNNQNGPFGPPPGGGGWGPAPAGAPPADHPQQGYPPPPQQGYASPPQQGYASPQQGYAPPPQQGYASPPQQAYPMQHAPQGYPPPQHAGYPVQAYPMQPQGYPGQPPPGYGQAPINIVVQNNAGGAGGLVRVGNKSRMTAALLAIFIGCFGIHKFYLGRTGLGILYLVFSVTAIPGIIGFIEGILLLMMSDHDFDLKYNSALTR